MAGKRPTNFERHLDQLEELEQMQEEPRGILEIFERDEDAPLARGDENDAANR